MKISIESKDIEKVQEAFSDLTTASEDLRKAIDKVKKLVIDRESEEYLNYVLSTIKVLDGVIKIDVPQGIKARF